MAARSRIWNKSRSECRSAGTGSSTPGLCRGRRPKASVSSNAVVVAVSNGDLYTRLFEMAVDLGYVVLLVELDARDVADASPVFYMKTQCQAIFLKVGDGNAKDIESEVVRAQRRD